MSKNIFSKFFVAVLLGCMCTSCATCVNGTTQKIPVVSRPDDAAVHLNGRVIGHTPMIAVVKRSSSHTLKLTKPGYRSEYIRLNRRMGAETAGNLLMPGGLIGLVGDQVTGGAYHFVPEEININLEPDLATHTEVGSRNYNHS